MWRTKPKYSPSVPLRIYYLAYARQSLLNGGGSHQRLQGVRHLF